MSYTTKKASILSISGNYTLSDGENVDIIEIDSSSSTVVLTLAVAANNPGKELKIKVVSHTNLVTVSGTIDGETNFYMNNNKDFIVIYSNGTAWKKRNFIASYETGWINRSDWTAVDIGSNTTKNVDSNVTHNLNQNLNNLSVKLYISTDGTDNNSFEVIESAEFDSISNFGLCNHQVDTNNILKVSAQQGIRYVTSSNVLMSVSSSDWYYKIVVERIK